MDRFLAVFLSALIPVSSALAAVAPGELSPDFEQEDTSAPPAAAQPAAPAADAAHPSANVPKDVNDIEAAHGRFDVKYDAEGHALVTATGPMTPQQTKAMQKAIGMAGASNMAKAKQAAAQQKEAERKVRADQMAAARKTAAEQKARKKANIQELQAQIDQMKHPNGRPKSLWTKIKEFTHKNPVLSAFIHIGAGALVGAMVGGLPGAIIGSAIGFAAGVGEIIAYRPSTPAAPAPPPQDSSAAKK